ncbi:unnamed protein product [Clonostachys chloroleuca]|uniref:N-acetyltransferase domain-containing protein n=1 Tax=Clonostachys chloroleuca TaxID=1926264 RepID=A0AA35QF48_9HYPO|nr:unnamed protein product [Clonostachys chloroleuca]
MVIVIRRATRSQIPEIVSYVMASRAKTFPGQDQAILPDLAQFPETYIENPDGCFLTAHGEDGQIVAAIGYLAYDPRFTQLDLGHERVVEVVRLYVDPSRRRDGLASRLFAELMRHAHEAGIGRLYLHTHPHLPGAIRFWERQGFAILDVQETAGWGSVVHMSRSPSSSPSASLQVDFVPNAAAPKLNGSFAANHQQIRGF